MGDAMMGMLVILCGLTAYQFEGIFVKSYGAKHGKGGMFFNAMLCFAATVFFAVTDTGGFILPRGVLIYGLINSVIYAVGFYAGYMALKTGSFGLTRLFGAFDSMLVIFYGILVLSEPVSFVMVLSILLIFLSVVLMRYQKNTGDSKPHISIKWVISLVSLVLANAAITVISKMQHAAFSDAYRNEYLIVIFLGSTLWLCIMSLFLERGCLRDTFRHGALYACGAGLVNGINNLTIMMSYSYFPISFIAPVRTGLAMCMSFAVSALVYKERFSRRQILGVVLGIAAVILINLG